MEKARGKFLFTSCEVSENERLIERSKPASFLIQEHINSEIKIVCCNGFKVLRFLFHVIFDGQIYSSEIGR